MVGSRHLFGTVLTRVENLLKSGALVKEPVWFNVVKAFPPLVETKINRRAEPGRAPKIVYPEDTFRNKFYSKFKTKEPLNLFEEVKNKPSPTDRFVEKCQLLVVDGKDSETAFEEAAKLFKQGELVEEKLIDEQSKEEDKPKQLPDLLTLLSEKEKNSSHKQFTERELEDKPL